MQRRHLVMTGTVQGVGYRPWLYRLARRLSLTGATGNRGSSVWCEIQGAGHDLDEFEALVRTEAPVLARVESVRAVAVAPLEEEREFTISTSDHGSGVLTGAVPADVAPCDACSTEIMTPGERRHRYAFTCCTNCGPRYTVVRGLPYDRERTSMAAFDLCAECMAEYHDPDNRRHHAQALSCPACGPKLSLLTTTVEGLAEEPTAEPTTRTAADGTGSQSEVRQATGPEKQNPSGIAQAGIQELGAPQSPIFEPVADGAVTDPIAGAVAVLRAGGIVAVKGVGGYQLMCRADHDETVARLRRRKHREEKPFALLAASLDAARTLVHLDDLSAQALSGPETPIVLAPRHPTAPVADAVAPDTRLLGVMLPATPLHQLLATESGLPLVCTSGNRSDEPIVTEDAAASRILGGIADAVLCHDRAIERRADDSIGHVVAGSFGLLRRARGYAPGTVRLGTGGPPVLGVGAELKSTVCLAIGADAHLSVHLGDLEHPAALAGFEAAVADLVELTGTTPELVVHDLHPEYLSTKFALSADFADLAPRLGVQHHHAHLASALADARYSGPAVGLMFDGMGWGTDATLWGGEVLVGDAGGYERFAHLRAVPMPGGGTAVRHPWRMALAHLSAVFGTDLCDLCDLPWLAGRAAAAAEVLEQCSQGRSILTTSVGRLFDSVAVLCGIAGTVTYEGQAAIRLEQAAQRCPRRYGVEISDGRPAVIEWAPLVEAVTTDLLDGQPPSLIAAGFHRWVVDMAVAASRLAREASGLSTVALSGGVFQNRLLVELLVDELDQAGFRVLRHRQVPPNDGGISLGQVAVVRAMLAEHG